MRKTIRKWLIVNVLVILMVLPLAGTLAQTGTNPTPTSAVGTLVPPTLVPVNNPTNNTTLTGINKSGIETLQQEGILRVGARFNVEPFIWLGENGELTGYEADIARALAEEIGVEIEFVQVTAETELQMLLQGEVDMLIGQQLHTRHAEEFVEFSHTYYYNEQEMVIREADIATYPTLQNLANHRVSVVAGSRGEEAINIWMAENGIGFELVRHLTMDSALDALANGEVDGMVGELDDLVRASRQHMSLVPNFIRQEPYAIAFRRHDVNLRNLINRSLQRLMASGTLPTFGALWFPDQDLNYAAFIPIYTNLQDDTRTYEEFPPDIPIPARSVLSKIRARETLNIAGGDFSETPTHYDAFLDTFHRELITEMARRWGVGVNFLPNTITQGVDFVATGQADIGVGVRARWDGADRADYSVPYHYSSHRILVYRDGRFHSFGEFRGGSWIGYFQDQPADKDYLESLDRTYSVYGFTDFRNALEMFQSRDVDGMFADTVRLLAFMADTERQGIPWELLDYAVGFQPFVLAVPRNDADFLTLVNWTLGDMFTDGTLAQIWQNNYNVAEWATYGISVPNWIPDWPGIGDFLNERGFDS